MEESSSWVSAERQRRLLARLLQTPIQRAGEEWFLVAMEWWEMWKRYVDFRDDPLQQLDDFEEPNDASATPVPSAVPSPEGAEPPKKVQEVLDVADESFQQRPGPIDNFSLVPEQNSSTPLIPGFVPLRPMMMDGLNFSLVPKAAWDLLLRWYGGGPTIRRLSTLSLYSSHSSFQVLHLLLS